MSCQVPLSVPDSSERMLRAGELRMRQLVEEMSSGVLLTDGQGVIRQVNPAARYLLNLCGQVEGEAVNRLAPFVMNRLRQPIDRLLFQQVEFDELIHMPDGEHIRQIRIKGRAVHEIGLPAQEFLFLMEESLSTEDRDHERVRLAEKLKRSQRMESFGLLAAGISHDINNVLTCVMGGAEILGEQLVERSGELQLAARQIADAAEHGAMMTRKVLSMARLEEGVHAPVNLSDVIKDVLLLLRRGLGPGIRIDLVQRDEELLIMGDTTSLHQVLLNLVMNARDALNGSGTLRIAAERCRMGDVRESFRLYRGGSLEILPAPDLDDECPVIRLEVQDNGCGMEPALLGQVFDPFFTTKDTDKGTGLGLHMVKEIALQTSGWLGLQSEPGTGTRFTMAFPMVRGGERLPDSKCGKLDLKPGQGTILVVEDDENVRKTMLEILGFLGYKAESAEDGLAAMELYRQDPNQWDLVLMDLKMPRMDGVETLRRMFLMNGQQRVLVSTGYASGDLIMRLKTLGSIPLINKPVRMAELSQELSRLMS